MQRSTVQGLVQCTLKWGKLIAVGPGAAQHGAGPGAAHGEVGEIGRCRAWCSVARCRAWFYIWRIIRRCKQYNLIVHNDKMNGSGIR